ncbi:MAG: Gfo/Idh/MocA family protein [Clostridiales bacterium]
MNVLLVGLGSIGKKHIKALKTCVDSCTIYALRSGNQRTVFEDTINIYSLEEISDISFGFAIISNPTNLHVETISELLDLKIPMMIEKPLSFSLEISDLINKVNALGIRTYIACNLRFLESLKFVKEYVGKQEIKINEVNVYAGSFLPEWRPSQNYRESYSADSKMGGGVHLDLIHELDYLYWIFGMPKKVSAILKSQSSLSIDSIDYANYNLEYNGFCASVILNYYRRDAKRTFELVFENETWIVDLMQNSVFCSGKTLFSSQQSIADTYSEQMSYFVDSLQKYSNTFNTIENAYDVLKICLNHDIER